MLEWTDSGPLSPFGEMGGAGFSSKDLRCNGSTGVHFLICFGLAPQSFNVPAEILAVE
jgi:hypothetical protein